MNDQAQELAMLTEDFLNDYFAFYPTIASNLGLHAYDGQIIDLSANAIATYVNRLRDYQQRLAAIDAARLEEMAAFDYQLLHWQIERELWRWLEEREYQRNPMIYAYNAMVDTYVKRDYAPLEVRVAALIRHLQQIPAAMQVARQNLLPQLPRIFIEESLTIFTGLIVFLTRNLAQACQSLTDPTLEQKLWTARDAAVVALQAFHDYLRDACLPMATDAFAIGTQQFAAMLRYNEQIDLPLDQLLALGERDLARNQQAIRDVATQIDPTLTIQQHMLAQGRKHPSADQLIAETRALLEDLRTFVIEHDIVSVPSTVRCRVEETPPFARWAFAMMNTAGSFETVATESFYYVTLPEPHWSPEDIEGWLTKFDYGTLVAVSIHEAYPGHYVHFLHLRHAPTRLAKVCTAYSHIESWAHYVEQMMLEEGYGSGDLTLRLTQLAEALTRNCRYICAIKMHTQGMTVDAATRYFMQHAYMDEVTARQEARRGTYDPGYINYTLGKLLLLKLRKDYQIAHGPRSTLKQFHDAYISYGAPPIPLLRTLLLPNDDRVLI